MNIKGYNFLILILSPFITIFYFLRVITGKEDGKRFLEKISYTNKKKPDNKLVWFHACSVGETKSIYILVKKFIADNYEVLITTNTRLSSVYVNDNFSKKVYHQYLPLDFNLFTKRFLRHWNPSMAIFTESELWPNLINNTCKLNIPLFLVQARISNSSLRKWKVMGSFLKTTLNNFNLIIAKSDSDKEIMENKIGIKISGVSDLKFCAPKLKFDTKKKRLLLEKIKGKNVISAMSTHAGEEKVILESFKQLYKKNKSLILMIQPRHPNRRNDILNEIEKEKFIFQQRSKNQLPSLDAQVYLFDTFGESGLLISISNVIILGGTFVPIGGHNLIEAAQFSKSIIIGPYYNKIKEIVELFKKNNAVIISNNISDLYLMLFNIFNKKINSKILASNARKVTLSFEDNSHIIYKKMKEYNANT